MDPNAKADAAANTDPVAEKVAAENHEQVAAVEGHPATPPGEELAPQDGTADANQSDTGTPEEKAAAAAFEADRAEKERVAEEAAAQERAAADQAEGEAAAKAEAEQAAAAELEEEERQRQQEEAEAETARQEQAREDEEKAAAEREALIAEADAIGTEMVEARKTAESAFASLADRLREVMTKLDIPTERAPAKSEYEVGDRDRHPIERLEALEEDVAKMKLSLRGLTH